MLPHPAHTLTTDDVRESREKGESERYDIAFRAWILCPRTFNMLICAQSQCDTCKFVMLAAPSWTLIGDYFLVDCAVATAWACCNNWSKKLDVG